MGYWRRVNIELKYPNLSHEFAQANCSAMVEEMELGENGSIQGSWMLYLSIIM